MHVTRELSLAKCCSENNIFCEGSREWLQAGFELMERGAGYPHLIPFS